jgi:hypothetical protein
MPPEITPLPIIPPTPPLEGTTLPVIPPPEAIRDAPTPPSRSGHPPAERDWRDDERKGIADPDEPTYQQPRPKQKK